MWLYSSFSRYLLLHTVLSIPTNLPTQKAAILDDYSFHYCSFKTNQNMPTVHICCNSPNYYFVKKKFISTSSRICYFQILIDDRHVIAERQQFNLMLSLFQITFKVIPVILRNQMRGILPLQYKQNCVYLLCLDNMTHNI